MVQVMMQYRASSDELAGPFSEALMQAHSRNDVRKTVWFFLQNVPIKTPGRGVSFFRLFRLLRLFRLYEMFLI